MSLIQEIYNTAIRPYIPRTIGVYAGVPAKSARLLDVTKNHPEYKQGLLQSIEAEVDDGDTVCLIGFGRGVSTVYALRAGADEVIAYEGAREMIEHGRETLAMQDLGTNVQVHHAIVGEGIDIYGTSESAQTVAPSELPECDVLVMDCEGAELSILEGMTRAPPTTIVETHPPKGAADEDVRTLLDGLDYEEIVTKEYEPDRPEKSVMVATTASSR